jgi:hypothetical protein
VFTLSECFDDEGEIEEADEEDIELLEAGKDSAEALESSEQPFDFVALPVEGAVVLSGFDAIALGWNHWNHAQIEHQLPCFVALIRTIHEHGQAFRHSRQLPQQLTSFWSVVRVARGQSERYGRSSICGNHMHLGVPSATAFADGLWSVFFRAPVPSG